jgi:tRNA(Met) C34 N-acetyltransferase TmcA
MKPVYIRQTPNEYTGEYTCVMLMQLKRIKKIKIVVKRNNLKDKKSTHKNKINDLNEIKEEEEEEDFTEKKEVVEEDDELLNWLEAYFEDFACRLCTLLSFDFSCFPVALALSLFGKKLDQNTFKSWSSSSSSSSS